jgi:GT2 family glycosyltransferase
MDATVVIPTFERAPALLETLDALAANDDTAPRWETIVVDDGSRAESIRSVSEWIARSKRRIRLLQQEHRGPAAARNLGAQAASGRFLIFIDNDILVRPDFIRRHVDALLEHPGAWIVGRIANVPELRQTPFGRYRDEIGEAFHRSRPSDAVSEIAGMTAANLSMPAADFAKLGGFDARFPIASCEDLELSLRGRAMGIRVLYDPRIVGIHNDWAVDLDRFCERQRLYSVADVALWRKYGTASPRAELIRRNQPIQWTQDSIGLIAKKCVKCVLASPPGIAAVRALCALGERIAPDSYVSTRAYDIAVAIAIFRGVRQGFIADGLRG